MAEKLPEKIGVQLFYCEVTCHKHVKTAIEQVEAEGHSVLNVIPLMNYDPADGVTSLRAVIIFVAAEARALVGKGRPKAG